MNFRLAFDPKLLRNQIQHSDPLMLVGSCFTENIGNKLLTHKFNVMQNPHGILFNPISVAAAITDYIEEKEYSAQDLFYYNEAWHSWQHHSRFSSTDPQASVHMINEHIRAAHLFLKKAGWLIVTLGSAWVYELTDQAAGNREGSVAANNHKAPASWFYRRLCRKDEIYAALDNMIFKLRVFNPALKTIFTISPVRHSREGFVENNRSKSILNLAVHTMVDKMPGVEYFPAYELVIDDLRDYRFYAEDMVHPNYLATNYVWGKFRSACISAEANIAIDEINELNAAMAHKPFNAESQAHLTFKKKYLELTHRLAQKYPNANFDNEAALFKA